MSKKQQLTNENQLNAALNQLYEEQFFAVCESKAQLKQWIKTFLDIDLPDCTVDDNSNSNPMDFIWDVYSAAKDGDPNRTTFVVAASRNSAKTLASSIIEFLLMVHFARDIVHMAAILDQSLAAIRYLDKHLALPIISNFAKTDSKRIKELNRLPPSPHRPVGYSKLQVVVSTKKSANAQRASCLIFDELDLIDKDILSEATFIADPDRSGKPPIFIYLSSRKSGSGPIQQKIDEADMPNSGIRLHKWSIVDWMQTCPPERHKPELPQSMLHVHPETLEVLPNNAFNALNPESKVVYSSILAYEGCKTCPVFSICRTKSVKQQSKSKMLRDLGFVKNTLLNAGDPDKINAQILNLKPESSGIVFNKFNRNIHVKSIQECWHFAFNTYPIDRFGNIRDISKEDMVRELRANGWRLHCGVDFGFIDPAVAVLIAYKKSDDKILVLHTEYSTGYANPDWLAFVKENVYLKYGFDLLCPDTADKSSTSVAGSMNMPARGEKPLTIDTGVSWIRSKLWNAMRQQAHFIILDDPKNLFLIKCMENWTYSKGAMGYDYSRFADDDWTHGPDALRYAIDPFITNNGSIIQASQADQFDYNKKPNFTTVEGMQEALRIHYASEYNVDIKKKNEEDAEKMLKSGSATILF